MDISIDLCLRDLSKPLLPPLGQEVQGVVHLLAGRLLQGGDLLADRRADLRSDATQVLQREENTLYTYRTHLYLLIIHASYSTFYICIRYRIVDSCVCRCLMPSSARSGAPACGTGPKKDLPSASRVFSISASAAFSSSSASKSRCHTEILEVFRLKRSRCALVFFFFLHFPRRPRAFSGLLHLRGPLVALCIFPELRQLAGGGLASQHRSDSTSNRPQNHLKAFIFISCPLISIDVSSFNGPALFRSTRPLSRSKQGFAAASAKRCTSMTRALTKLFALSKASQTHLLRVYI